MSIACPCHQASYAGCCVSFCHQSTAPAGSPLASATASSTASGVAGARSGGFGDDPALFEGVIEVEAVEEAAAVAEMEIGSGEGPPVLVLASADASAAPPEAGAAKTVAEATKRLESARAALAAEGPAALDGTPGRPSPLLRAEPHGAVVIALGNVTNLSGMPGLAQHIQQQLLTALPAATLQNGLPGATNFVPVNFDGNRLTGFPAADPRLTMGEMWLEGEAATLRLR